MIIRYSLAQTENGRGSNDCVDIKDLERKKKAAWLNVLCSKATRMNQATNENEEGKQKRCQEMTRKIKAIIRMKNEDRQEREKELSESIGRANVKLYWKQVRLARGVSGIACMNALRTEEEHLIIFLSSFYSTSARFVFFHGVTVATEKVLGTPVRKGNEGTTKGVL